MPVPEPCRETARRIIREVDARMGGMLLCRSGTVAQPERDGPLTRGEIARYQAWIRRTLGLFDGEAQRRAVHALSEKIARAGVVP